MSNDMNVEGMLGGAFALASGPGRENGELLKLVFVLRRRSDMTSDEFYNYWRNEHGPLVRKQAAALRVERYAQVHTVAPEISAKMSHDRGCAEPYDGVAEVWVRASNLAAQASPEGREASMTLLEDEKKFIDLSRSAMWFSREIVFVDGGEPTEP